MKQQRAPPPLSIFCVKETGSGRGSGGEMVSPAGPSRAMLLICRQRACGKQPPGFSCGQSSRAGPGRRAWRCRWPPAHGEVLGEGRGEPSGRGLSRFYSGPGPPTRAGTTGLTRRRRCQRGVGEIGGCVFPPRGRKPSFPAQKRA